MSPMNHQTCQPEPDAGTRRRSTHVSFTGASQANADTGSFGAAADLLPADLLDNDEIVIFAVKPSLWMIVFLSFRWLAAMGVVIVMAVECRQQLAWVNPKTVVHVAAALGAVRVGLAMLQWASKLYVLTNRRILRLSDLVAEHSSLSIAGSNNCFSQPPIPRAHRSYCRHPI